MGGGLDGEFPRYAIIEVGKVNFKHCIHIYFVFRFLHKSDVLCIIKPGAN